MAPNRKSAALRGLGPHELDFDDRSLLALSDKAGPDQLHHSRDVRGATPASHSLGCLATGRRRRPPHRHTNLPPAATVRPPPTSISAFPPDGPCTNCQGEEFRSAPTRIRPRFWRNDAETVPLPPRWERGWGEGQRHGAAEPPSVSMRTGLRVGMTACGPRTGRATLARVRPSKPTRWPLVLVWGEGQRHSAAFPPCVQSSPETELPCRLTRNPSLQPVSLF
jgi:hypothetical protein